MQTTTFMKVLSGLLMMVFFGTLHAQDIIITKDAQKIDAKILEVSGSEIKYKKQSNLEGPTFILGVEELNSIIYANGEVQVFTNKQNFTQQNEENLEFSTKEEIGRVYRNWNGLLDYIHINTGVDILQYNTLYVYINPLDISREGISIMSDEQYSAVENSIKEFPYFISQTIRKTYPHLRVEVVSNINTFRMESQSLLLKLNVDELDMGNRNLRIWVGFGAGNQKVAISGIVLDSNNSALFDFWHRRLSSNWKTYEDCLQKEFKNFAKDITSIFVNMRQ